ncbi:hypothetical protein GTY20_39595 [Streptomyces sp. SID4946]|uniref:hypothetical protein n=1 Tax=Streptomyces sp. LamerLS-31b TaxID=1839765 RepID=UPI00081DFB25|nr:MULTISPECIES: hypothetical protein [unclassified Streptomyces]MYQ96887.1 hypothetical protein [Streptomyces sp. SID4946]SCG02567.1 hypothetical protein GA0115256_14583 [Streptomyces sp. DconLS]SCG06159.1 hypothetical protein GA0115258_13003 [Streptomyces sp. LamerLS-31b]
MAAAQDEFARFEVCEQRAAGVLGLLYARPGPVPPHCGPPTVRTTSYGRALALYPIGHLAQSVRTEDWHGSQHATRCSDPAFTLRCHDQTSEPIPH